LTVPVGTCPTVGLSGLIQGGGYGLLAVNSGLTCDRVIAADVVVWQPAAMESGVGERYALVHATENNEHSELLFALRGGLGGNYGVVVTWHLRALEKPASVQKRSMTFSVSAKDDMISVMKWLRSNDATATSPLFAQFFFANPQNASLDVQCHCWESCDACLDALHQIDSVLSDTPKPRSTLDSMTFDLFPKSEIWQREAPNLQAFSMYFDDDILLTNEGLGALFFRHGGHG
jgi:FAD/FMN-containing dehydrogenase